MRVCRAQHLWSLPPEQLERIRHAFLGAGEQVPVAVEHDTDRRVRSDSFNATEVRLEMVVVVDGLQTEPH